MIGSKKVIILLSLIILLPFYVFAQEETTAVQKAALSIDEQFEEARSEAWQEYWMVKKPVFVTLRSNVSDSLEVLHKQISEKDTELDNWQAKINKLNRQLTDTKEALDTINLEKDSLRFFGILMGKAAYNSLMLAIIVILAALLTLLFISFKRSHAVTSRTKQDLEQTIKEFEEHRTRARLKEEKIVREYHYELNKYKNR